MGLQDFINNPQKAKGSTRKTFIISASAIFLISILVPKIIGSFGLGGIVIGTLLIVAVIIASLVFSFKKFGVFDLMRGKMNVADFIKSPDIPNGLPATATVISAQQGGTNVRYGTYMFYQILIKVTVRTATETWQATIDQMTPITQVTMFQPGLTFSVIYDPNDKSKVIIDQSKGQGNTQGNTQTNMSSSANIPGAEQYTHEDVAKAAQMIPPELVARLQQSTALLQELKITGTQSTARIVNSEVILKDMMPGVHILKVMIEVSGTIIDTFESEQYLTTPNASLHKFDAGNTVYIRYDSKNPRRVIISGSDKPDTGQSI